MKIHSSDSFLAIVTAGRFAQLSEDRLTQVISAAFMHSKDFRKTFVETFNLPKECQDEGVSLVLREENENLSSTRNTNKPDVRVIRDDVNIAIIEVKTASPVDLKQLNRYSKDYPSAFKLLLTLAPHSKDVVANWKIGFWSALEISLANSVGSSPVDKFIIDEVRRVLHAHKIPKEHSLSESEFKMLFDERLKLGLNHAGQFRGSKRTETQTQKSREVVGGTLVSASLHPIVFPYLGEKKQVVKIQSEKIIFEDGEKVPALDFYIVVSSKPRAPVRQMGIYLTRLNPNDGLVLIPYVTGYGLFEGKPNSTVQLGDFPSPMLSTNLNSTEHANKIGEEWARIIGKLSLKISA